MNDIKRLPDAELEVMLIIWKAEPPVTANQVLEHLKGLRPWSLQTLFTVLSRLVDKGFLEVEKVGRSNLYRPLVEEHTYKQIEGKNILERLYDNSFTSMVTNLVDAKAIGKEELGELRRYLDELEGK